MDAFSRYMPVRACALIAAFLLLGCSLQNFDYLTQGSSGADSGSGGDGGGSGSDGPPEAAAVAETGSDAKTSGSDATVNDGSDASDGTVAQGADAGQDAPNETGTVGAGNLIINPNFDQGFTGWSVVPVSAMNNQAVIQPPIGTMGTTPQGQAVELGTYSASSAFVVDVSQTVNGLQDGTYVFSGYFSRGPNNAAYVFATNCGGPTQQVNIPVTSSTGWVQVLIPNLQVTGGMCEVGFHVDAAPTQWLNADGFSFTLATPSADAGDGGAATAGDAAKE